MRRREERAERDGGGALDVVVEREKRIAVAVQERARVRRRKVLPLEERSGQLGLDGLDEAVDEREVRLARDALLAPAEVLRVPEQLLVVRPDVEDDRKSPRRRDAADERVERQLADRDAEAADTLVADAEDALAVRHDDDVDVRVRPVAQQLRNRVAHVVGNEEAARAPVDVAELLARLGDDGRVDDRQHLLDVGEEEAVEEDLVRVLERAQLDVPPEGRPLGEIGLVGADELVVDRLDLVRQEAVEAEFGALLRREGRALVPGGGLEERHSAQPVGAPVRGLRVRHRALRYRGTERAARTAQRSLAEEERGFRPRSSGDARTTAYPTRA